MSWHRRTEPYSLPAYPNSDCRVSLTRNCVQPLWAILRKVDSEPFRRAATRICSISQLVSADDTRLTWLMALSCHIMLRHPRMDVTVIATDSTSVVSTHNRAGIRSHTDVQTNWLSLPT